MSPILTILGLIILISVIALIWISRKREDKDSELQTRLAEFIERGDTTPIRDLLKSLISRLQGDSSTDAPPPESKKKKKGKGE